MATSLSWFQGTKQEQFPLNQLPVDCLGVVLSHMTPRETCRLSCISSAWKQAAESEEAWRRIIPWRHSATSQFPALNSAPSARHAYDLLLAGCRSSDGKLVLKANPGTGRISLLASAISNFSIVWFDPQKEKGYWRMMRDVAGSDFATCAFMNGVCWFRIQGNLRPDVALFPGAYRLSWKVAKCPKSFDWPFPPAACTVLAGDDQLLENVPVDFAVPGTFPSESRTLGEHEGGRRGGRGRRGLRGVLGMGKGPDEVDQDKLKWEEFVVGEVMLKGRGDGFASFEADIDLVEPNKCGTWKRGLYVDSFVLTRCA